jgi:hypothetical protein
MRDASLLLESLGVNSVDVNMGCPVKKICKNGGGSALMTDHAKAAGMVKAMVDAVKIPVTCKMRLGWDDANHSAPHCAREFEQVGVAAVIIHGRTREQGFSGNVNRAGIRSVVEAIKIPSLATATSPCRTPPNACSTRPGCAAISIGAAPSTARGFSNTRPLPRHRRRTTGTDARRTPRRDGGRTSAGWWKCLASIGCRMFRKSPSRYATRFGPSAGFKRASSALDPVRIRRSRRRLRQWRAQFLDENRLRTAIRTALPRSRLTIATPKGRTSCGESLQIPHSCATAARLYDYARCTVSTCAFCHRLP